VSSSWRRSGRDFSLTVQIPVGASAEVLVPAADGYTVHRVGSGTYTFHSTLS
jgi:alpha-L-rhamnosidase